MNSVILRGGQRIFGVHSSRVCAGERCPIHNVSDHPFRKWDQNWNGQYMERTYTKTNGDVLRVMDPDQPVNGVHCNRCGQNVYSWTRHDFKWCPCRSVAVDGGLAYKKRSFKEGATWTELS